MQGNGTSNGITFVVYNSEGAIIASCAANAGVRRRPRANRKGEYGDMAAI
ncbi:MAG: hypothetical protein OXU61_07040 [Gammaproteobacteria bacterium]|nr:hypothetical protein [Gammaproteobacteria bacterium]